MFSRRAAFAAAGLLCFAVQAHAQQYPCWNSSGMVNRMNPQTSPVYNVPDPQASATWDRLASANDPRAAQALAGTWYMRNVAPQSGQVQEYYATFDPNGLFQYRDQTCGSTGMCSRNQGNGQFRAAFENDGSIFYMTNFSDLNRDHQCVSDTVRVQDNSTLVNRSGNVMRRVQ